MITRQDAVSAIGFDGNAALVDRTVRARFGLLSTAELLQAGQYRAAAVSALYSGNGDELALVAKAYNEASGSSYTPEQIPRLFGVSRAEVPRTLVL